MAEAAVHIFHEQMIAKDSRTGKDEENGEEEGRHQREEQQQRDPCRMPKCRVDEPGATAFDAICRDMIGNAYGETELGSRSR